MANSYFYSNTALPTTLSGSISAGSLSIGVGAVTGFPTSFPYVIALDYGASAEELALVTNASGTTLTVTRAFGGTSAQSHSLGAAVRHVYNAQDAIDYRTHEASASGVHGVTGAMVGTTDAQTLTNKTLSGGVLSGTFTGSPTFSGQPFIADLTNIQHDHSVAAKGGSTLRSILVGTTAAGVVPLTVQHTASPTVDLLKLQNSIGTDMVRVTSGGCLSVIPTVTTLTDYFNVMAPAGANASSALLQLYNNAVPKFAIDMNGNIVTAGNFSVVLDWQSPALATGYTNNGNTEGTVQYRVINILGATFVQWRGGFNVTYTGGVAVNGGKFLNVAVAAAAVPTTQRSLTGASQLISGLCSMMIDARTDGQMYIISSSSYNPSFISLNGWSYSL